MFHFTRNLTRFFYLTQKARKAQKGTTLRPCGPPEWYQLSHAEIHRIHRLLVFSNNAGLESTEFASRFALAGLRDALFISRKDAKDAKFLMCEGSR